MSAAIDIGFGGDAGYGPGVLPGDVTDTAQIAPYVQTAPGMSWWEGLIAYGVTKAIDNRVGPTNMSGNTSAGSYGGANGRTYANNGSAPASSIAVAGFQFPMWAVLAAAVGVGYLALRKG